MATHATTTKATTKATTEAMTETTINTNAGTITEATAEAAFESTLTAGDEATLTAGDEATLTANAETSTDPSNPTQDDGKSSDGDALEAPSDDMVQRLYHELRNLAAAKLNWMRPEGQTLQPTVLVHEVYLRLNRNPQKQWKSERHFCRAAARAMRHVLIDHMRARNAARRGGQWLRTDISISLADEANALMLSREELMALDSALSKLQAELPDLAEIVLLRYYCGLTVAEIAKVLDKSKRTVERNWRFVRAWLLDELADMTR